MRTRFDLRKDLNQAIKSYPSLRIVETNHGPSLSGEVELIHHEKNVLIDAFSVNITYPVGFPYCFPRVMETLDKIKRIPDRHVYNDTNHLCLAVPAEERIKCKNGITTLWFLNKILVPRLAEEYIVNQGGTYKHEFSHGSLGKFEYYCKEFKVARLETIISYLEMVLKNVLPKRNEKCMCDSGLKFKNCHKPVFEEIKGTGYDFIRGELCELRKLLLLVKFKSTLKR